MDLEADRVEIDPTVVRGLDYYTGPVFEAVLTFEADVDGERRSFGSVAGGGRYDDLVKRFTGQEVAACGASIGVDRLLTALRSLGQLDETGTRGPVVVTVMDKGRLADYQAMVSELRRADIAAELFVGNKNIGTPAQVRRPSRLTAGRDRRGRRVRSRHCRRQEPGLRQRGVRRHRGSLRVAQRPRCATDHCPRRLGEDRRRTPGRQLIRR